MYLARCQEFLLWQWGFREELEEEEFSFLEPSHRALRVRGEPPLEPEERDDGKEEKGEQVNRVTQVRQEKEQAQPPLPPYAPVFPIPPVSMPPPVPVLPSAARPPSHLFAQPRQDQLFFHS